MSTDAQRLTLDALDIQTDLFRFFSRTDLGVKYMNSILEQAIPYAAVDNFVGDITDGILTSPVYAVTSEIADVISSAAVSLPSFDMQPHDMPTEHGFVWLEEPLMIEDRRGENIVMRAFGWITSHFVTVEDDGAVSETDQVGDGVFFVGFTDPSDERDHLYEYSKMAGELDTPHQLLPIISGIHSFDHPEWISETDGMGLVKWFMAFTRFVGETWVDRRMVVQPRHAIKRAMRATPRVEPPSVQVVQLRRREQTHAAPDGEDHSHDWSHRWLVRGHWRNQWYPSMQAHRPKWIPEHIKGPDDKPLIVRDKIFSVSR